MSITEFMDLHYRHFNARETVDSARAWKKHLEDGGEMMLAMAGAMSTAELGISLADMIRQELAGALGEKITHSVRKLVRQEIQRSITLRRLE